MLSTDSNQSKKQPGARAIIYARVATSGGVNGEQKLESRIEAGRIRCAERGYIIVEEVRDDGISGVEINRPGLNEIRQMAAANRFDVLVVGEPARLSRNMAQRLMLEEELKQHNISIECVSAEYEGIPTCQNEWLKYEQEIVIRGI